MIIMQLNECLAQNNCDPVSFAVCALSLHTLVSWATLQLHPPSQLSKRPLQTVCNAVLQ